VNARIKEIAMVPEAASFPEFMQWVAETRPEAKEHDFMLFYRGHSDYEYKLEPGIYRRDTQGRSLRALEHQMYEEMLRRSLAEFQEDRNLFERLIRMQHYELPTRLLDITSSPLVALYFACYKHPDKPEDNKDGEVLFFPRKREMVEYCSNIPDIAMAGIERKLDLPEVSELIIKELMHFFDNLKAILPKGTPKSLLENILSLATICSSYLKDCGGRTDALDVVGVMRKVESDIAEFSKKCDDFFHAATQNSESYASTMEALEWSKYCEKIKVDFHKLAERVITSTCRDLRIGVPEKVHKISDFLLGFAIHYFILPPINNERIRRQQGAFIISPVAKTSHWSLEATEQIIHRVRIKAHAKQTIIKELSHLGVTRSFLFPELTQQAFEIKQMYSPVFDPLPRGFANGAER
jgi:hypothetical protein